MASFHSFIFAHWPATSIVIVLNPECFITCMEKFLLHNNYQHNQSTVHALMQPDQIDDKIIFITLCSNFHQKIVTAIETVVQSILVWAKKLNRTCVYCGHCIRQPPSYYSHLCSSSKWQNSILTTCLFKTATSLLQPLIFDPWPWVTISAMQVNV